MKYEFEKIAITLEDDVLGIEFHLNLIDSHKTLCGLPVRWGYPTPVEDNYDEYKFYRDCTACLDVKHHLETMH